jgi:membrane-associated phospholipid phosphatase
MRIALKVAYVTAALLAFFALARRVRNGRTGELDARITRALQNPKPRWFDSLMHSVSWPGFPPQSRIIPWLLPTMLFAFGRRFEAAFQLAGWGTGVISGTVKFVVRRPRPALDQFRVTPARIRGTSFPSGHVIIYTGVYGTLAYLAHCHLRIGALRKAIVGTLTGMIALVGPSRIYLGHHWFSDVVASYLLGTSYLVVLTTVYQKVRGRADR